MGINEFERLKNLPPKCWVCGHNIIYHKCEGVWICEGCGQVYDDS